MDKMIVYEDKNIIVVHKPAGIATQTGRLGQADLVSELKNYRKRKGEDTYIGVVHRLDQPVEGLLVFAKDAKSAKELTNQLGNKILNKSYTALVLIENKNETDQIPGGELTDYLLKDNRTNMSKVVEKGTRDAKEARLKWEISHIFNAEECGKKRDIVAMAADTAKIAMVKVEIFTGRHHQIRVQMSNAGMPLLGDQKYGSELSKQLTTKLLIRNTALLADKIEFEHPVTKKKMKYVIEPENIKSMVVG